MGFGGRNKDFTLDKNDAKFVDVIHTNMESFKLIDGYGTSTSSGHVDFYPEGGETQKGCGRPLYMFQDVLFFFIVLVGVGQIHHWILTLFFCKNMFFVIKSTF